MTDKPIGIPQSLNKVAVLMILTTLLGGCAFARMLNAPPDENLDSFREIVQVQYLNEHINLELVDPESQPEETSVIYLLLRNRSEDSIAFDAGYGIKIFVQVDSDEEWTPVENRVEYLGAGEILEPRADELNNWFTGISVAPYLGDIQDTDVVRIYVEGKLQEEVDPDPRTGAFLDVPVDVFR